MIWVIAFALLIAILWVLIRVDSLDNEVRRANAREERRERYISMLESSWEQKRPFRAEDPWLED